MERQSIKFTSILCGLFLFLFPLHGHELVDMHTIDPQICISPRDEAASSPARCYLVKHVAKQLSRVQKELEKDCIRLVIFEGYRPFSERMRFDTPYSTSEDECSPVSNGHYKGTAVDVSLCYMSGQPLEMPPFVNIYELADWESDYQNFSCLAYHNLQTLRKAMEKHRFVPSATEWWHFDYKDSFQYPVLDVPLKDLTDSPSCTTPHGLGHRNSSGATLCPHLDFVQILSS